MLVASILPLLCWYSVKIIRNLFCHIAFAIIIGTVVCLLINIWVVLIPADWSCYLSKVYKSSFKYLCRKNDPKLIVDLITLIRCSPVVSCISKLVISFLKSSVFILIVPVGSSLFCNAHGS